MAEILHVHYPSIKWVHLIEECEHADHGMLVICCSDDRFMLEIINEHARELGGSSPLAIIVPAPTLAFQDPLGGPFLIGQIRHLVEEGLVRRISLWEHIHCAVHRKAAPHLGLSAIVERQQHGLIVCQDIMMSALSEDGLQAVNPHFADWSGTENARVAAWQRQEEALQFAAA